MTAVGEGAESAGAAAGGRVLPPLATLREGGRTVWVSAPHADTAGAALLRGAGLGEALPGGRGAVRRFPLADGGEGVLRVYRRGGAAGRLLPEGRLADNRARRELLLHRAAWAAGIAVPEPLGAAWERRAGLLRGAIATRAVAGATLLEHLRRDPDAAADLLPAAGARIRQMHDAGFWHADLQGHNILASPDGPCLIDFDNARRAGSLGATARARNLLRFRRSLAKHGWGPEAFSRVLEGYGPVALPGWLDALYTMKDAFSDRWTRR